MRKFLAVSVLSLLVLSCSDEEDPVDCETEGPILSLGVVTDATSCTIADGVINVSASQGKEPYEFSLNDLPGQSSGQFNNLSAGIYTVNLKDANGCTGTIENVTIKAADFTFTADITADNSCLGSNGSVTVDVTAGNPPYTYKLGNGSFSDVNTFSGLSTGNHSISVMDNNGCSVTLSLTVPRGLSGISWENQIKPIMENSCALSGCHNGSSRPDLRKFENAKFYAKSIKSKTQDRSMPREGALTQQQIDLIACWVDDGAQQN
ncbi:MAG TPA: hypothetical protein VK589_05170 [Chryseolinea sp.]|nr:hypothetical protein [Chryseolinea sp.]